MKVIVKTTIGQFEIDPFDGRPPSLVTQLLQPAVSLEAVPGAEIVNVAPYGEPKQLHPLILIGGIAILGALAIYTIRRF